MPPSTLPVEIRRLRNLVLLLFYGLWLVLFFNSLAMTTGLRVTTMVIWLIEVLPLALFVRSLHKAQVRSYAWFSFVVLMYFVHGVLTAFTPGKLQIGLAEIILCALLFAGLIAFIRRARRISGTAP